MPGLGQSDDHLPLVAAIAAAADPPGCLQPLEQRRAADGAGVEFVGVVDDDGAVLIPAALLDQVLAEAPEQERMEEWIMHEVERGVPLPGLYPMNAETKARMKAVLEDIQTGKFVRDFMQENAVSQPFFKATRRRNDAHQIEQVGEKLRGMMPWISKNKLVDQTRN